jgi:acetylornithine deacetylase/succinyl-diaminopimelate desuccinylase-like protein
MGRWGPSDSEILGNAGGEHGWGERGFSLYERTTIRPALTFNGIVGGYQGPGSKAVIPARDVAKLNFRLASDQDPREIEELFREHIARISRQRCEAGASDRDARPPLLRDRPMRAAAVAYRKGFGADPVFLRVGGSLL